jgi:hypothetical protein
LPRCLSQLLDFDEEAALHPESIHPKLPEAENLKTLSTLYERIIAAKDEIIKNLEEEIARINK